MAQGKLTLKVRDDKVLNFYYYSKKLLTNATLSVTLKNSNPTKVPSPVLITPKPEEIVGSTYPYVYHFIDGGYEISDISTIQLTSKDANDVSEADDTFTNQDEENGTAGNLEGLPPENGSYFRTFIYTLSEAELARYLAEEDDVELEINGTLYPPISSPSLTNDVYTYIFQVNAGLISAADTVVRIVVRGNEVFNKKFSPLGTDINKILQEELLSTIPSIDNNLRRLASENRVQSVKLAPPSIDPTSDEELWKAIRKSKFNFVNYGYFINEILQIEDDRMDRNVKDRSQQRRAIRSYISPFQNVASYQYLKQATDLYLLLNSYFFVDENSGGGGSIRTYEGELLNLNPEQINELYDAKFLRSISRSIRSNFPTSYALFEKNDPGFEFSPEGQPNGIPSGALGMARASNFNRVVGGTFAGGRPSGTLRPQLAPNTGARALANPFGTQPPQPPQPFIEAVNENAGGITGEEFEFDWYNLSQPMIELIWSYWMEELGLVQTMNAISMRFQNVKKRQGPDPLANLALDSLRPIGNLLWGYVEDERVRTSMIRRCYEYEHQYGISLRGKAVPQLYSVESRSRFIGAFHQLIKMANDYYQQSNILTVKPDAFPLLNQLKEVHIILREGQHNQFRDLTWSSRVEMLTQQWLLDREEVKEFIRGRYMVPYEEGWMGTVDTMKRMQNWNETSVSHFYHLATNGEQLLLSIRYGDWASPDYRAENAATWAHFWRDEIQRYLHAYRAVTSVDLSADVVETRPSPTVEADRFLPPAHHIERREINRERRDSTQGQNPPPVFSRNGRW